MKAAHRRPARHRPLAVTSGLLALAGIACMVFAITHQQHAAQPSSVTKASSDRSPAGATAGDRPAASPTSVMGLVLPSSVPVIIRIPAIGVSSPVQLLGQNSDGSMQVPAPGSPRYDQAGWYRYSPTPGALGPAVIAGHLDSVDGPSVFFRLGSLHLNDAVLVTRADGSVAVFTIDGVRRYAKSSFPTQLVYGNTDHAALRLITCGGSIDPATGHYRDNVVVLASLVRVVGQPSA